MLLLKDEKYCPVFVSVAVLVIDAFIIIVLIVRYDFCWYKDAMELEASPMSYAANCVKFQEGIKTMAQGYKL